MFIEAIPFKRGKDTVHINTNQIMSVEFRLRFMDYDYKVTMMNGKQFIVDGEAKQQLRSLLHTGRKNEVVQSASGRTDPRQGAPSPTASPGD